MAAILVADTGRAGASLHVRSYALIVVFLLTLSFVATQWTAFGQLPLGFSSAHLSASRSADYSRDTNRKLSELAVIAPDPATGQENISVQQVGATSPLMPLRAGIARPPAAGMAPDHQLGGR